MATFCLSALEINVKESLNRVRLLVENQDANWKPLIKDRIAHHANVELHSQLTKMNSGHPKKTRKVSSKISERIKGEGTQQTWLTDTPLFDVC